MTANDTSDLTWLDEAVSPARFAIKEHDHERERCANHGAAWCCPAGDAHAMTLSEARYHQATAAILAALPAINEAHAKAIEGGVLASHPNAGYRDGHQRAADIVRGFGSEVGR